MKTSARAQVATQSGAACSARRSIFRFGQSAERMIDNRRHEIVHAERVALHFGLVEKLLGGDDQPPSGGPMLRV